MAEIIKSIIFGIVEGITEWLPVSSTGHMILLNEFIKFDAGDDFMEMYLVAVQLGAIMAVVILYWKSLWPFSLKPVKKDAGGARHIKTDIAAMWVKIVVACVPAAVLELVAGDKIEELFYNYRVVAAMLILVGILFIIMENGNKKREPSVRKIEDISYKNAFLIGLFQLVAAVFPGTSRSGATIIGGLALGLSRTAAAEFTFYLAVPVMFGASLIKMLDFGAAFTMSAAAVLLSGMASAFIVSLIVIKFFMGYIKNHFI